MGTRARAAPAQLFGARARARAKVRARARAKVRARARAKMMARVGRAHLRLICNHAGGEAGAESGDTPLERRVELVIDGVVDWGHLPAR